MHSHRRLYRSSRWRILSGFAAIMLSMLYATGVQAQEPVYKIYGHENGLRSNDVLAISQDNLGYLWIINGAGVTRFDGTDFSYTPLKDKYYRHMYQDHLGRVWMHGNGLYSHPDQLKYCYNGRVYDYEYNHVLDSVKAVVFKLLVDEEENLWLGLYTEEGDGKPIFMRISKNGQVESYYLDEPIESRNLLVKQIGNQYLLAKKKPKVYVAEPSVFRVFREQDTVVSEMPYFHDIHGVYHNNRLFFSTRFEGLYELKNSRFEQVSDLGELAFSFAYIGKDGRFLVPSMNYGLHYFPSLDMEEPPVTILKEAHFCSIFQSKDGGYWLGTRDQGVYHIPVFDLEVFDKGMGLPLDLVEGIQATDSTLWITYRTGISKIALSHSHSTPKNYHFGGLLFDSYIYHDSLLFLGGYYAVIVPNDFPYEVLMWPGADEIKKTLTEARLSWRSGHSLHTWYGEDNRNRPFNFFIGDFATSHLQLNVNDFLYSDGRGLKYFNHNKIIPMERVDSLLGKAIYGIEQIDEEWMLLASSAYGILAMKDTSQVQAFGAAQGLSDSRCEKLFLEDDSTFWVVTETGLDQVGYSIRKDTVLMEVLWQLGPGYGVSYIDIVDIQANKESVWLASRNTVLRIPKNLFKEKQRPEPPVVKYIYQGNQKVSSMQVDELTYHSGITEFEITSPYFTNPSEISFKYQLDGDNSVWKHTTKRRITFDGIAPGAHQLKIVAIDSRQIASEPLSFNFKIAPVFWQTTAFRLGVVAVLLALLGYLIYRQHKARAKKRRLLLEIKTHKNTALRLRMNPHFIYNSLGSIQSFVLKEESRVSSKYIAKLSRLMRLIFDHNNRELISLQEELDVLALYVDLEFLRHDQELKYELNIDPSIKPEDTMVPPMLLQPLVENAILHGLIPKKGIGILSVTIKSEGGGMVCVVSDNGTGIRHEDHGRGGDRKSGGIITADRIGLFNQQHGFDGFFQLEEKSNLGTQVAFSLAHIRLNEFQPHVLPSNNNT